jgi:hypothetical protein
MSTTLKNPNRKLYLYSLYLYTLEEVSQNICINMRYFKYICYALFVCAAGIYGYRFVCNSILSKSRNRIQIESTYKCKTTMLFLDHHVLSNGDIVLAVSPILCTGNWTKLFTKTVLAFKLHFFSE